MRYVQAMARGARRRRRRRREVTTQFRGRNGREGIKRLSFVLALKNLHFYASRNKTTRASFTSPQTTRSHTGLCASPAYSLLYVQHRRLYSYVGFEARELFRWPNAVTVDQLRRDTDESVKIISCATEKEKREGEETISVS